MNIEMAKAIPIAQILEKLALKPAKETETDAMYLAPWRNERTASLHVNKQTNEWFDHGEDIGGNAFNLVVKILKEGGYSYLSTDALRWIRNTNLDPSLPIPRDRVKDKTSKWELLDVMQLECLALTRYLRQRGIDVEIAKKYVREIYVRKKGTSTKIYALGFKNEEGGYELRNRYFKSCVAPKDVSFIRGAIPKPDAVMIFEGFIDFLTYATIKKGVIPYDCIILNSVACVDHAFRYIKNYGYSIAYSWMDNDKAGEKAKQRLEAFIETEAGLIHKPLNYLYEGHKDLNAWHMHKHNLAPIR